MLTTLKSIAHTRLFFIILLLVCVSASLCCATNLLNTPLPKVIRTTLDQQYPGWKFADLSKEIHEYLANEKIKFDPNLISGDFDGDGSKDYAIQIMHEKKRIIIAFLKKDNSFTEFILETNPGYETDLYLWLFKKGEQDHDYGMGEDFFYVNDSIGVLFFEKSGVSYVFEKGRFRKIWSSD